MRYLAKPEDALRFSLQALDSHRAHHCLSKAQLQVNLALTYLHLSPLQYSQ